MIVYPDCVLACPATMKLLLRSQTGELPRGDFYAAWDALADPDAYEPSDEVREWMQTNWRALVPADLTTPAVIEPPVLTEKWMEPFLEEFAKSKNITKAAKVGPVSRMTVHSYLSHDPEFARAFDQALETFRDRVRKTFKRRALDGWDEPVFGRVSKDKDGIVGHQRKYDPRAFMRLVEKECPEYAAAREGTTVNVTATANAAASAQAASVTANPARQADIQARTRHKLAKRVESARLAATTTEATA